MRRNAELIETYERWFAAADALHQAGERAEAEVLFAAAERMQAERQPEFPLLDSLQGFRYADLLLAPAERAAGQKVLVARACVFECGSPLPLSAAEAKREPGVSAAHKSARGLAHSKTLRATADAPSNPLAACAEAEHRAVATVKRRTGLPTYSLLNIGLNHLTQARAALCRALLTPAATSQLNDPETLEPAASPRPSRRSRALRQGARSSVRVKRGETFHLCFGAAIHQGPIDNVPALYQAFLGQVSARR